MGAPVVVSIDDIKRLVGHLESASRAGGGAQLSAAAVETLLGVLCEQIDRANETRIAINSHPFQVVALATEAKPDEILALSSDALLARAIFDEAAGRLPDRKIRLKYRGRVLARAR
jgi:hypothetical protein